MDQSRSQCPLLKKKDAVQKEEGKVKENKYDVKPPRDLRSKYLIKVSKSCMTSKSFKSLIPTWPELSIMEQIYCITGCVNEIPCYFAMHCI